MCVCVCVCVTVCVCVSVCVCVCVCVFVTHGLLLSVKLHLPFLPPNQTIVETGVCMRS